MEREKITMLVARNIEIAMERLGTNPSEVARRAKINPTGVYDILSGKSRNPRLDTLYKIASQGLGVPFSELFSEPNSDEVDKEISGLLAKASMLPHAERTRLSDLLKAYLAGA